MTLQFTVLVILFCFRIFKAEVRDISLGNNDVQILDVPLNASVHVYSTDVLPDVAYILCQAHTQTGHVTLSTKPQIKHDTSVYGRDVGVLAVTSGSSNITFYLYSNSTSDIKVLVHLKYFTYDDPLVGGCNEEFNLENDPNIHLYVHSTKSTVQFQWSNTGINTDTGTYPNCEDSAFQSELEYHIYVKYMEADDFREDTYFNVIKMMLTEKKVAKYGTKLTKFTSRSGHKSFVNVSSYSQRGVVYNTVVKFRRNGRITSAAYVPVASYTCDIEDVQRCKQRDLADLVLITVGGLVGLFICFFGHRFFKTENFFFGFLIFGILFYQVFSVTTGVSYLGTLVLAAIFGLIGGALLLGLWWYYGIPVLNVLFIAVVMGYLMSSVLFYTPFGNLSYLQTPFNYGASFTCGVLIIPVLLLFFTKFLSIFSCAVVGSFTFMLMFDTYLHSALYAIIVNSIRHCTDKSYVKTVVTGPFTNHEITLSVVWIVLTAFGTGFQLFRERKKAPFPPCPRQLHNRSKDLRRLLQPHAKEASPDREPLIRGGNQRRYGAIQRESPNDLETESSEVEINRPGMI